MARVRRSHHEREEETPLLYREAEEPQIFEDVPIPVEGIAVKWVDWHGCKHLYVGRHYFGVCGPTHNNPHRTEKFVGNVLIPGIVGPIAYGPSMAYVMHAVRVKALEWLHGLCGEAPDLHDKERKVAKCNSSTDSSSSSPRKKKHQRRQH